uniref:Uncharacterized protein n=1 Tax=Rhizophora mucronata TaxID=61149 RepID=A0A2P2PP20_RHIMU
MLPAGYINRPTRQ